MMRVCQRQGRLLWESLREWLSVPPFSRAFLKSPSSRGLSAIAELLVLSFFFFGQQPSELAGRHSIKTGYMLRSECDLKMHVRNLGYLLPTNRGPQNHLFRRLHNLMANLMGVSSDTRYKQSGKCVDNYTGFPTSSRNVMTPTNG